VYASPSGGGQCSLTQPCTLSVAIMVAANAPVTPIVRMLPGNYTEPLEVHQATAKPIEIVATGASISPSVTAIVVDGGADVRIRGLTVVNPTIARCGLAASAPSALSLQDASLTLIGNSTAVRSTRCKLKLSTSEISLGSSEILTQLGDDSELTMDRIHIHGNASHHITGVGKHLKVSITNSLFEDVGLDFVGDDSAGPGSSITIAESTLIYTLNTSLGQGCDPAPNRVVRYENSIIASLGAFDSVREVGCTFVNTILARQQVAIPGTVVADPQFVAPALKDFHIQNTSPAVDAATTSIFGLDSAVDLEGVTRPQGAKADIGAFETERVNEFETPSRVI
jgi:hypothetical protein